MTNLEATFHLCNAIINTFFPDEGAVRVALMNYGIEALAEAVAMDARTFRAARDLCLGYVESSRSENGISTAVRSEDAVKRALRHWCRVYDLDEDEELSNSIVVIDDASNRW